MSRVVTLKDGNTLKIHDKGEALSDRILKDEDYFEREILDYLEKNHKDQKVIIDVGANIGNHTVFFAAHLNHDAIVSYEPILENYLLLAENTKNIPTVWRRREAVGDQTTDVMMRLNKGNMGACEIDPEGDIKIHQVRLDDTFIPPISLIKIDAEWYELQVLEGAKALINEDHPLILIEDSSVAYEDYLRNIGYQIEAAWPDQKTYLYKWVGNA